jgi:hypothetical protein
MLLLYKKIVESMRGIAGNVPCVPWGPVWERVNTRTLETRKARHPAGILCSTRAAYEAERARINIASATSVPTKAGSGRMNTIRTPHRNCVLKQLDP